MKMQLEEYIEFTYAGEQDDPMYTPDVYQSRKDYEAGWRALQQCVSDTIREEIDELREKRPSDKQEGLVISGQIIALQDLLQKITP